MSTVGVMLDLMGGAGVFKEALEGEADLERAVVGGLPATVVSNLAKSTGAPLRALQQISSINKSTFDRRLKLHGRLKTDESDRIARVARVAALAIEALGRDNGLIWLRTVNLALGRRVPLEMLGTDAGIRQVEQIIGRIEHGVFS
jgi:putative toxin-antitoxin system antitoxin component (TIGR02293 family)